jgi:hypothetical protein
MDERKDGRGRSSHFGIADDAAGYGWSDSLDALDSTRVDLLSAVTHEFGHNTVRISQIGSFQGAENPNLLS